MPAREWHRYLAAGLLRRISDRIAKPARNVIAWLEGGKLHLLHAYSILTFSILLDRMSPGVGEMEEVKLFQQYATPEFRKEVATRLVMPGFFLGGTGR